MIYHRRMTDSSVPGVENVNLDSYRTVDLRSGGIMEMETSAGNTIEKTGLV